MTATVHTGTLDTFEPEGVIDLFLKGSGSVLFRNLNPVCQGFNFVDICLDVALSLQPRGGHVTDLSEYGPLEPGPVVHSENPGHAGVGIGVPSIQKIGVVDGQGRLKGLLRGP